MYEITWVRGTAVQGISSPKFRVALAVYVALRVSGYNARLWNRCTKSPVIMY